MGSLSPSVKRVTPENPNMVHENLPLRFWEESHRFYKQYKSGKISVEDCFDMQQELYKAEMDKIGKKQEEPAKGWEKYKKLDSLFAKIKSKTEEQRVNLENDIRNSKVKEKTKSESQTNKYILPKSMRDDEPTWLTNMVENMLKSWTFITDDGYICEDCDEKFAYMAHFESHVKKKHTDYKPFACNLCAYAARGKCLATDHVKMKHNPSFSNLVDSKVDEIKPTKGTNAKKLSQDAIITKKLEQLWMFTKEGSNGLYDCDMCRKDNTLFTSAGSHVFEEHIQKSHPGYKPFTCNVCPFTANRRSNLTTHVKKFHFKMLANLA